MRPQVPSGPFVDNSVNNHGLNNGVMKGGTVNWAVAKQPEPAEREREEGFDPGGRGVFVNYRQGGAHARTVLLVQQALAHRLGPRRVFFDNQSIMAGGRYPDLLRSGRHSSRMVLALIHPTWLADLHARWAAGAQDWVVFEIETALRAAKVVMPVLLDGASMPAVHQLPPQIGDLAHRAAWSLRELPADLARLADTVARQIGQKG